MKRKNPLAEGTKQKAPPRPSKQEHPRSGTQGRSRKSASASPATTGRGGARGTRGRESREARTASTPERRASPSTPLVSRSGAAGGVFWGVLSLLLVLASLGVSPFVFWLRMEVLCAPAASATSASGSKEGTQRAHLKP
jgi:hypothetical protein